MSNAPENVMAGRMRAVVASACGILAAAAVPAALLVVPYAIGSLEHEDAYAWVRIRTFATIALFISAVHVLVLGLPAFLLLHGLGKVRWWSAITGGFVLGCIPVGVWTWPMRYTDLKSTSSYWDGEKMVQTMVDGVPTAAGWLSYVSSVSLMGLLGALGGLAFWLAWWGVRGDNRRQRSLREESVNA
ncbi:MAG TPA: hypothetical protein VLD59_19300 [Steroidobacteraceae bacterium]|nr:hypothetical protein [Steroidobacteraceae bacterium]